MAYRGFLGDLSGIGRVIQGGAETYDELNRARINQLLLDQQRKEIVAQQAAGSGLTGSVLPAAAPSPMAPVGNAAPALAATASASPPSASPTPTAPPSPGASAIPQAISTFRTGIGDTLSPYAIADRIKKANPGIKPDELFMATAQTIKMLGPYAQLSARDEMMQLRQDLQLQMLQNREQMLQETLKNKTGNVIIQQAGANQRTEENIASREKIANARNEIYKSSVQGQPIPLDTRVFLAQELISGNLAGVNEALGFSRNRVQIIGQVIQTAQQLQPGFDGASASAALASFGGTKTAANVVGRTAGSVAVGAAEIPKLVPQIMAVAKRLNPTQYPTVNAVEMAAKRGVGNPDVVQLNSYIQSIKNAYQQISARGGRLTDVQREQADALIKGTMPISQLAAAAKAMTVEAGIVKGATGEAMKDVTGVSAPPAQGSNSDPLGIR